MGTANKQKKTLSTLFITREVKTIMRYYNIATKMAEMKQLKIYKVLIRMWNNLEFSCFASRNVKW